MFSPILIISLREVKNALENHYLFGMILLLATLSLSLILLGDTPVGSTGVSQLSTQITSLSSLSIFFYSFDGVVYKLRLNCWRK
jgi:Cu-processing system permease protein